MVVKLRILKEKTMVLNGSLQKLKRNDIIWTNKDSVTYNFLILNGLAMEDNS